MSYCLCPIWLICCFPSVFSFFWITLFSNLLFCSISLLAPRSPAILLATLDRAYTPDSLQANINHHSYVCLENAHNTFLCLLFSLCVVLILLPSCQPHRRCYKWLYWNNSQSSFFPLVSIPHLYTSVPSLLLRKAPLCFSQSILTISSFRFSLKIKVFPSFPPSFPFFLDYFLSRYKIPIYILVVTSILKTFILPNSIISIAVKTQDYCWSSEGIHLTAFKTFWYFCCCFICFQFDMVNLHIVISVHIPNLQNLKICFDSW